jgi:ferrous iron transport protein B
VAELHTLYPKLPNARWVALRLLDGDERIIQALKRGELGDLARTAPEATNGNLVFRMEASA